METDLSTGDALDGIPMLGPTRRARLAAAGFATPETLALASVEEIARAAQMPKSQAQVVLEYARNASEAGATPPSVPEAETPTSDDALAEAIARMRAAVDGVLAHKEAARVIGPLARFAGSVERLAAGAHRMDDATRARLTRRLSRLAARLEGAAAKGAPRKRFVRLRERLKAARRQVRKSFVPLSSE